jgi:carbon storage regulator
MLVLSRKIGEDIIIDGSIRITITAIKGDRVRIGVEAPAEVHVDRQEVRDRIREFAAPDVVLPSWSNSPKH